MNYTHDYLLYSNASVKNDISLSGNKLWDSIIQNCIQKPTFLCIQKNVYTYLDDTLTRNVMNVTDRVIFTKNINEYHEAKSIDENESEENEILDDPEGE